MKNDAMDGKKCGNNIFVTVLTQKLYFIDEYLSKFRGVNSVYAQNMNSWREKMKRKTQKDMCVKAHVFDCERLFIWTLYEIRQSAIIESWWFIWNFEKGFEWIERY